MTFLDIVPVVVYQDIAAAHDFLVDVLGFTSGGIARGPAGTVVHGEVRAGDRRIWLHAVSTEHHLATPAEVGSASGGIVVHVDDVDAHFERVSATGANVLRPPTDEDYGQCEYGVADPEGHSWWIATPIPAPPTR